MLYNFIVVVLLLSQLLFLDLFAQTDINLEQAALEVAKNNILLEATATNLRPYEKEAILVNYYLVVNPEILIQDIKLIKAPTFSFCKTKEIDLGELKYIDTLIENILFKKAHLNSYIIIPQKPGESKIGKLEMKFYLKLPINKNSDYSDIYKNNYYEMVYNACSEEKILHVMKLPLHKEKCNFVGDFDIDFSISKITAKKNENILLNITISGAGYLGESFTPIIEKTDGLKTNIYKTRDTFDITSNTLTSWKNYEVDLISTISGDFFINPIEFLCFSPTNKKYYKLKTDGFSIFYLEESEVAPTKNHSEKLINIILFIIIAVIVLLTFLIFFYIKNKNQINKKNFNFNNFNSSNPKNTTKSNNKYLADAFNNINGDLDIFLKKLVSGIDDFLENNFEIKKNDFNTEEIYNLLLQKGVDEIHVQNYKIMYQKIDEVRFSPKQTFVDREKLFFFVERFLDELKYFN